MAAARVITYKEPHPHYHANFALYINGAQENFKDPKYYQEVAICKVGHGIVDPQERTHMHDNKVGLVHVHDHAVTWGQLFNNLGWTIGSDFLVNDKGTKYIADSQTKLNLTIDGQDYTDLTSLANTVIKDQSRVLISFGAISPNVLSAEFKTVPSTAKHADESKDPASCASHESIPFKERLRHIL